MYMALKIYEDLFFKTDDVTINLEIYIFKTLIKLLC